MKKTLKICSRFCKNIYLKNTQTTLKTCAIERSHRAVFVEYFRKKTAEKSTYPPLSYPSDMSFQKHIGFSIFSTRRFQRP